MERCAKSFIGTLAASVGLLFVLTLPGLARQSMHYELNGHQISKAEYQGINLSNEATDYLNSGRYDEALKRLTRALELAPRLPVAHTNIGLVLGKLGQTAEAEKHLKEAIKLDPTSPEPWINLGSLYQGTGDLKSAIRVLKEYLDRFPSGSEHYRTERLVQDLQAELADEKQAGDGPVTVSADDYFKFTTAKEGAVRWDISKMPLKVYVYQAQGVTGYHTNYQQILLGAFGEWNTASNDKIKFAFVDSPANADITCTWIDNVSRLSSPSEGGEADMHYGYDGMHHVDILLLTTAISSDLPVNDNEIRAIALHEIGHSLGLMGHSPDAGDTMYCSAPEVDRKRTLTARDVNTLNKLYSTEIVVAGSIKSSAPDKVALNNAAVDAIKANDYPTARTYLEKALELDANYDLALENLGGLYNNIAIDLGNSGKTAEAEDMYKKSIAIQEKRNDKAAVISTLGNLSILLRETNRDTEADKLDAQADELKKSTDISVASSN